MVLEIYHQLLKGDEWADFTKFSTDQQQGKAKPEVENPIPDGATVIDLPKPETFTIGQRPVIEIFAERRSHRWFTDEYLALEELAFLLWATQGIRGISPDGERYYRNVPSGGNRHPFETYLSISRVEGLDVGLYRYLPIEHQLVLVEASPEIPQKVSDAALNQIGSAPEGKPFFFVRDSAVTFIWSAIPYRSEWRYGPAGPKLVALDAGHVCQNLYTASGAIGAGTCSVGAFNRKEMDKVLGVDGEREFSFYVAPVGKIG